MRAGWKSSSWMSRLRDRGAKRAPLITPIHIVGPGKRPFPSPGYGHFTAGIACVLRRNCPRGDRLYRGRERARCPTSLRRWPPACSPAIRARVAAEYTYLRKPARRRRETAWHDRGAPAGKRPRGRSGADRACAGRRQPHGSGSDRERTERRTRWLSAWRPTSACR